MKFYSLKLLSFLCFLIVFNPGLSQAGGSGSTQKIGDITAQFGGCSKQGSSEIVCAVKLTNDSTSRTRIRVHYNKTTLLESSGDSYKPEGLRIKGDDRWRPGFAAKKVSPAKSVTYQFKFLTKDNSLSFTKLIFKLNKAAGRQEFSFNL